MKEERLLIGDIPTRLYRPTGARGLLLLGHGGGHSKDATRFVDLCRHYATRTGRAVACIDAVDHGERALARATAAVPRGWHARTVPRMVGDWASVAERLSSVGPTVAYVGFSMGALFGIPTVAAIPSIRAAVFIAGGIPAGDWVDDEEIGPTLTAAAAGLAHTHVMMLNNDDDELFAPQQVRRLFDAVRASSKQLLRFPGGHDDWSEQLIESSAAFIVERLDAHDPA